MKRRLLIVLALWLLGAAISTATAQVTISLAEYEALLARAQRDQAIDAFAVSAANVQANTVQQERSWLAQIRAVVTIQISSEDWVMVPLLAPDAVIESATANGAQAQLVSTDSGYLWRVQGAGEYRLDLRYRASANRSLGSWAISMPLPRAGSTQLDARFPADAIDPAVLPATGLVVTRDGGGTRLSGPIPASSRIVMTWRDRSATAGVLNRAAYSGQLRNGAIRWDVDLNATIEEAGAELALFSTDLTLLDFSGPDSVSLRTVGDRFVLRFGATGTFDMSATLESAIQDADGAPHTQMGIPRTPISEFTLTLPGDKGVVVAPHANVITNSSDQSTSAQFFVPLTESIDIAWMDAIPEDAAVEQRMSASVYQALMAAEGLVSGTADLRYEITRGSMSVARFSLPAAANVNRVSSPDVAIADWFVQPDETDPAVRLYEVYLTRAVSGDARLLVEYEQLLDPAMEPFPAPLIEVGDVDRQRGMLALLSGRELALEPVESSDMAPVGENQLPADFRGRLLAQVSHTLKYHQTGARVTVNATAPRREPSRFDVEMNALISVGEVALRGQLSVLVDIKSGRLDSLNLALPESLNVLSVTGPAIRQFEVEEDPQSRTLNVEFTRELDGRFQIDMTFERILDAGSAVADVPQFAIMDADVEHGMIAIEAIAALEITVQNSRQLTAIDISELPRALVLKTTNPILHAFRFVRSESPPELALNVTRHREIELKDAIIDSARYQTLITSDGLAVTRAALQVRNSRRQFLRLRLPSEASVWSAFVDGEARKPARAEDEPDHNDILIKMINATAAFEVALVYAVQGESVSGFGRIHATLPQADVLVTLTEWDAYVPLGPRYSAPASNLDSGRSQRNAIVALEALADHPGALKIDIPTEGRRLTFSKLYADQSGEPAYFEVGYVSGGWSQVATALAALAVILFWLGLGAFVRSGRKSLAAGLIMLAIVTFVIAVGPLGGSYEPAATLMVAIGLSGGIYLIIRWIRQRSSRTLESEVTEG